MRERSSYLFAPRRLSAPERVAYSYKLEGLDANWVRADSAVGAPLRILRAVAVQSELFGLKQVGFEVDWIVSSPLVRAVETAADESLRSSSMTSQLICSLDFSLYDPNY